MKSALIVDDHPMIHVGCNQMLKAVGVRQTWEAEELEKAVETARVHQPDLIVLDVSLPQGNGLEAIGSFRAAAPDARILVFTMNDRPVFARRALDAGADGFLSKNAPPSSFRDAISTVARGRVYLDHTLALEVITLQTRSASMTQREIDVLRLLAQEMDLKEIATELGISYKTVANICSSLKKKTGTRNLVSLMQYAAREFFNIV